MLPILWLVLIARLIHDEALVGDQQFWLTRPYTWSALLAAKLLFLVLFVFVPFLVMQCYLLAHAGLNPLASIPGLLLNLLYLILICFLPFTVAGRNHLDVLAIRAHGRHRSALSRGRRNASSDSSLAPARCLPPRMLCL